MEKLRRDVLLKSILSREGIGRNEFLLEALILLLQLTRSRQDGIAMKNDGNNNSPNNVNVFLFKIVLSSSLANSKLLLFPINCWC